MTAPRPVFGIADTHLGFSIGDTMSRFGWHDHPREMTRRWRETVPEDALVLIPGDLTISTRKADVLTDVALLDILPGQKIVSHGNHDRSIWASHQAAVSALSPFHSLTPLKSEALRLGEHGVVIAATRGALSPEDRAFGRHADHAKDHEREMTRAQRAMDAADRLRQPGDDLLVMIHYPPFANCHEENAYTRLIEDAGATLCVYGHLHDTRGWSLAFQGVRGDTHYTMLSADYLDMRPRLLGQLAEGFQADPQLHDPVSEERTAVTPPPPPTYYDS